MKQTFKIVSYVLLLGLIITCSAFKPQVGKQKVIPPPDEGLILWQPQLQLTWADFKGTPDMKSEYKAMTSVRISDRQGNILDDKFFFTVSCYFNRRTSWSKEKTSLDLLKHEKLHFDIAELTARKIRESYSLYHSNDVKKTYQALDSILNYYSHQYLDSVNASYDGQTSHGIIKEKQEEWEKHISKELELMKAYSDPKVIVKRVSK